jgi:hypothetical protein
MNDEGLLDLRIIDNYHTFLEFDEDDGMDESDIYSGFDNDFENEGKDRDD